MTHAAALVRIETIPRSTFDHGEQYVVRWIERGEEHSRYFVYHASASCFADWLRKE